MKKVLVTGGAGFIGSNMVERLVRDGHEVVVLDNLLRGNKLSPEILSNVRLVEKDIRDMDAVLNAAKGCDVIVHYAAVLGVDVVAENPIETMEVEAIGMMNLVRAAFAYDVSKMLYASTSGVYGHSKIEKKVTEADPVDPVTSYAIAKRYNEIYLEGLHQEHGFESVSLRFFNVYGKNQDTRMVIPRFIEQALAGKDITVFDDGTQTRDFTYIDDTVEACIQLMEKSKGADVFNVANSNEMQIIDLAHAIKRVTGSNSPIVNIPSPGKRKDFEVARRYGSSAKLTAATGFTPNTNLDDGLSAILKAQGVQA